MKKKDYSGMLIPGGLLIGIGVGMAVGQIPAGTLIGLGLGFVATYIFRNK
ncbi:hypothetical protein HOG16_04405 [Candidatus Woesearchaeota archaeon]|jgi:hypothetical protein|nr:hypothetical protein [Candidatus Woesearchaeota archaeon]MBT4321844.1 hypothetical protein [Candidatus Woesearchaeota archaeon]